MIFEYTESLDEYLITRKGSVPRLHKKFRFPIVMRLANSPGFKATYSVMMSIPMYVEMRLGNTSEFLKKTIMRRHVANMKNCELRVMHTMRMRDMFNGNYMQIIVRRFDV